MDDNPIIEIVKDAVNALGGLFMRNHREVIQHLKAPTPVKASFSITADANGLIGGGFANPSPVTVYQVPMSHEAWIHRLAVSSPSGQPKAPLTTGQAALVDGAGSFMYFLPIAGNVAPVQITEGFASAVHLNAGSKLGLYGDSFTPGTQLRFDLQIILTTGISEYMPLDHPSHITSILD